VPAAEAPLVGRFLSFVAPGTTPCRKIRPVPLALVCFLASAAAYAGFQWTVHVVVYRQFAAVPADAFAGYELSHQRRISYLVGPLFAALIGSVVWLILDPPPAVARWAAMVAGASVALILATTAVVAVPLHRRISAGWDEQAYRRLLRADLVRALAATVTLGLAIAFSVA